MEEKVMKLIGHLSLIALVAYLVQKGMDKDAPAKSAPPVVVFPTKGNMWKPGGAVAPKADDALVFGPQVIGQ